MLVLPWASGADSFKSGGGGGGGGGRVLLFSRLPWGRGALEASECREL